MFLIFDTETTGLPRNYKAPLSDYDNWPRMVQIAWQLHDESGKLLNNNSIIISPNGYSIPFNATQIHGISTERAIKEGKDLHEVLIQFSEMLARCNYIVGHNVEFDILIIGAEFLRCGMPNYFNTKLIIDTKNDDTTKYCALEGGKGGKYKWPTLTELYFKLFNQTFGEAHNAAFDVQATSRVFFEILKRKIIHISELETLNIDELNYEDVDLSELIREAHLLKKIELENKKNETFLKDEKNDTQESYLSEFNFSHLHNHSQFSVLQSTSDVKDLVERASEYNLKGLALTDHGNMYGAFIFWEAIEKKNKSINSSNDAINKGKKIGNLKNELKCILGCELNICNDHLDKTKQDNGYTQVFLCKNKVGYQNLSKLSSVGLIEGAYYVPRIDKKLLLNYREGLIATTGSLSSEIPSLILNVGEERAEEVFIWYKELFGDDFYIEINRHGLADENHVNAILLRFAKKHKVKYFAAHSNYYIDKSGFDAHDVLLCVKDGEKKSTPIGRGRGFRNGMPNKEFYFKSPKEMAVLFSDLTEAIETTNEIYSKIESFKLERDVLLPKFEIDLNFIESNVSEIEASYNRLLQLKEKEWGLNKNSEEAIEYQKKEIEFIAQQFIYMSYLTWQGAKKRYPIIDSEIKNRIDFELSTIERMGYPGYFLIVADFISEARRLGVTVGPGRGSAAGSAIAYCLGITNMDPIKYDLLFERFLNPDRVSMPDIDIDFDDEGRGLVIDYVMKKYGSKQVAQIITYGTMGGKSAIKDAARVLDLPLADADRLSKLFPDSIEAKLKKILGPDGIDKDYLFAIKDKREILLQSQNFRKLAQENSNEAVVLKQAYELEGCLRNTGTHACGIIITPDDMVKYVPVTKAKDTEMLVTQFDNSVIASTGLLKIDFLGLKTLTIIKDAVGYIKKNHKIELDVDAFSLDDKKTYQLFQQGETNGIFQYESAGMQKTLRELKPDCFNDLIAINALFRPGPLAYIPNYINRKHGREKVSFDLPDMEELLSETYGITVYQEQVMRLSQKLANFSKGDADTLRKAMGKKDKLTLGKMKGKFIDNCKINGYDSLVVEKIWKDWEAFASYAFNKSHSTCYAFIGFQTAYIKAHYPSEFMNSALNHQTNIESISFMMEECKRMKVKVLGPDVNESSSKFSVAPNGDIRFGMSSIKGVGENIVNSIVNERTKNGNYKSVFDLAARMDTRSLTKKSIEGLALSGAFDAFENTHRAMFFEKGIDGFNLTEKMIRYGHQKNQRNNNAQSSLFNDENSIEITEPKLPMIEKWNELELLDKEKEVIGIFISGHPLDPYKFIFDHRCNANCLQLKTDLEPFKNKEINFGGIVKSIEILNGKTGKTYGKIQIEDYYGIIELRLFGKDFVEFQKYFIKGLFVYIKAKVQTGFNKNQPNNDYNNRLEIKLNSMELLESLKERSFVTIKLKLNLAELNDELLLKLDKLINQNIGKSNLEFFILDEVSNQTIKLFSKKNKVAISTDFLSELDKIIAIKYSLN